MVQRVSTVAFEGIEARAVDVQVQIVPGLPAFAIVGLPDKAVSILDLAGARTRRRGKTEVSSQAVAEVVAELSDMPVERLLESDGDRMLRDERSAKQLRAVLSRLIEAARNLLVR